MAYGITVRVTHLGTVAGPILLSDVDFMLGPAGHTKPGPVYVPKNGTVTLAYSSTVVHSFEFGAIRQFIDAGILSATLMTNGSTALRNVIATPDTLVAASDQFLAVKTTTIGAILIENLPQVSTVPAGAFFEIKNDEGAFDVQLTAHAGDTIDGAATFLLSTLGGNRPTAKIVSDGGTNWMLA